MLARIKFDINGLVNEILDRLPEDVFKSSTTTFLDPAMAGGQFVVEIIRRLRYNGHSDANIAERAWGLAEDAIDLNYAINTKKLIGKYSVGNIETLEQWAMAGKKFDVVLGNPPYQETDDTGARKDKAKNLWSQFIQRATELVSQDGYIAMVTPSGWMAPASHKNTTFQLFQDRHLQWVNTDVRKHFSGVGSTFTAWVLRNNNQGGMSEFLPANVQIDVRKIPYIPSDITSFSIHAKTTLANNTKLDALPGLSGMSPEKNKGTSSTTKSSSTPYKVFHTYATSHYMPRMASHHTTKKVVWSISGYMKPFYDDGDLSVDSAGVFIEVSCSANGSNLVGVLNSKLYQYLTTTAKWSGFQSMKVLKSLPAVDLTRSWTDAELYAHFNLTQDEIDLIEATVK